VRSAALPLIAFHVEASPALSGFENYFLLVIIYHLYNPPTRMFRLKRAEDCAAGEREPSKCSAVAYLSTRLILCKSHFLCMQSLHSRARCWCSYRRKHRRANAIALRDMATMTMTQLHIMQRAARENGEDVSDDDGKSVHGRRSVWMEMLQWRCCDGFKAFSRNFKRNPIPDS
jgi:hypothetical protein